MKRLSITRHAAIRAGLARKTAFLSDRPVEVEGLLTDDDLDELIEVDPYNGDPPSKRSDKELGRVLSILDSLERGNG